MRTKWNGAKWIRRERRLAIYLRDGLCCVYCGAALEDGARLTLDHIDPVELGGGNESRNLITACRKCNDSKGDRYWRDFVKAVAEYVNHGVTADQIMKQVDKLRRRKVNVAAAKQLMRNRGSYAAALQSLAED